MTAWVVSLRHSGDFKAARPRLDVLIPHAVILFVFVEDSLAVRHRVGLTRHRVHLIVSRACMLQRLQLFDSIAVPVGLTVHVFVVLRIHRGLIKTAKELHVTETVRNGRRRTSLAASHAVALSAYHATATAWCGTTFLGRVVTAQIIIATCVRGRATG